MPAASIQVLLPAPGTPVTPYLKAWPAFSAAFLSSASAVTLSSALVLSTRLMARANAGAVARCDAVHPFLDALLLLRPRFPNPVQGPMAGFIFKVFGHPVAKLAVVWHHGAPPFSWPVFVFVLAVAMGGSVTCRMGTGGPIGGRRRTKGEAQWRGFGPGWPRAAWLYDCEPQHRRGPIRERQRPLCFPRGCPATPFNLPPSVTARWPGPSQLVAPPAPRAGRGPCTLVPRSRWQVATAEVIAPARPR